MERTVSTTTCTGAFRSKRYTCSSWVRLLLASFHTVNANKATITIQGMMRFMAVLC